MQFSKYYAVRDYPFTNAANQCCDQGGGGQSGETQVTINADYIIDPNDLPLLIHLSPDNGTSILVTLPWPLTPPPTGGAGSYVTMVDVVGIANVSATVTIVSSDDPGLTGTPSTIDNQPDFDFNGNFQAVTFLPETSNPNWLVT